MRRILRSAVGGVAAVIVFVSLSGTAWASDDARIDLRWDEGPWEGFYGGWGEFNADGNGSVRGDSIRACDMLADGFGVEVTLNNYLVATTRGHASPYCSDWKRDNREEGIRATIRVCLVKRGEPERCGWDTGEF